MSCCANTAQSDFAFDSPEAALNSLCAQVEHVATEKLPWIQASGRVLAADATADRPSPGCDVSAMDGYAIRIEDCKAGVIAVAGEVAIGAAPPSLPTGKALKIVTGAPVPAQADIVIKREDVHEQANSIELGSQIISKLTAGINIRKRGENMPEGTIISTNGCLITGAIMGMLTSFGASEPRVYKQVRLGIITTGNEVIGPDQIPTQWQLRDSNASSLRSMCDRHRWIHIQDHVHAEDTPQAIEQAATEMLNTCDALVFTGGVSMGDHDYVPEVINSIGAKTIFHKLPQRPGKPVLGAVHQGKPVLALPGNPLAVLVTAHRMLIPALAVRAGLGSPVYRPRVMRVLNPDSKSLGLWWSRLARVVSDTEVELVASKGSGDIPSAAMSDGFVQIPPYQSADGSCLFWSWDG